MKIKRQTINLVLSFFLGSVFFLNAQKLEKNTINPLKVDPEWITTYQSEGFIPSDIEVDSNYNSYSTGTFNRILIDDKNHQILKTDSKVNNSPNDYFLVKHNSKGKLVWGRVALGQSRSIGVEIDSKGNIYTVGEVFFSKQLAFQSTDTSLVYLDKPKDKVSRGIFICKYNPDGKIMTTKYFSNNKSESPNDFKIDKDDNLYIAGNYSYKKQSESIRNYLLIKFNKNLDLEWIKKGDASGRSQIRSINLNKKGDVYITGGYHQRLRFDNQIMLLKHSTQKAFIAKLNKNGDLIWFNAAIEQSNVSSIQDVGQVITSDKKGNVYMAGTSFSKVYLTKLNNIGEVKWRVQSEGHSSYPKKIILNKNKDIYILGFGKKISLKSTNKKNSAFDTKNTSSLFILKYNKSGKLKWVNIAGGLNSVFGISMKILDNHLYVLGHIFGGKMSFDKTKIDNKRSTLWLSKFSLKKFK